MRVLMKSLSWSLLVPGEVPESRMGSPSRGQLGRGLLGARWKLTGRMRRRWRQEEAAGRRRPRPPAPELVRFGVEEGSRDNDAALSGASGSLGAIGSLVAVVGVVALLCVFIGRADPKGLI